jgi:UDP-N-acetylmuramoylalanine--D-glutamate ligase
MIVPTGFKGQKVVVLGLGRSGRTVAQSLLKAGADVLAWDDQEETREVAQSQGIPIIDLPSFEWEEVNHLILSPGIAHRYPTPHPLVLQAQRAGLQPLSDLEVLFQSQPQACYIGITGTNGKSTTTALMAHILKDCGEIIEVGGNLGIPVMELNPLQEDGTYVLELSSYQLEIAPSLHLNVGVLLNITPDHLERHGGMEGYIAAKQLIYRNGNPQDTLVISVDDPYCLSIYESLKESGNVGLLPFSVHSVVPDGIYVEDGVLYEKNQPVVDLKQFDRLKGAHNWQNAAAAFAALRSRGLEIETIAKGMKSFPGLAHRQQVVAHHKNVLFVNDSKGTNGDAVEKALLAYQGISIYWLLGGQAKEEGITKLKPYFSTIKHAFLFGEASAAFASTLEGEVPYTFCETLEEAVNKASKQAFRDQKPDAVVLLSPACASFDQFKDFEERGDLFCQYVQEAIQHKKNLNDFISG